MSAHRQRTRLPVTALWLAQLWLAACTAYLLTLLAGGRRPLEADPAGDPITWPPLLALVPAHDEQRDIGRCVDALVAQDYPGECTVVVVADNCTDATGAVAREHGATVLARSDPGARGKGQALNWALQSLADGPEEIVVFVDADCVASPQLFREVARGLSDPTVGAVQARYEVSNPEASPTTALRAAGFLLKHVVQARGRQRLGISCGLFGSGMGFRRALLSEQPWPTSITEDAEMHLTLVGRGLSVHFVDTASVASPMPLTAAQADEQQLRWESGNAEMRRRHTWKLVAGGLAARRAAPIATGLELLIPPQSLLVGATAALGVLALALRRPRLATASAMTAVADVIYVVGGLACVDARGGRVRALLLLPAFVMRRLRILGRVMTGRGARSWVRTERSG